MNETHIHGVITIAKLSGISPDQIWNGTDASPGLKSTLDTSEKIETFNRTVEMTVSEFKSKCSNFELAMMAMNRAGEAILGDTRGPDPNSTEAFMDRAIHSGIMRRV